MTDNNFILSMSCPVGLPETKKNEIILDLYFFRSPAIKRPDKENAGINVLITDDTKNKKRYIIEKNKAPCNVKNNLGTICTTDMNTTTDLRGAFISYDEVAITNITTDENNSFIKTKISNIKDTTEDDKNLDEKKYKETLDKLLNMLEPYMKEEIHFSMDDFKELYDDAQAKSRNEEIYKTEKKTKFRNLLAYAAHFIKQEDLFYYKDIGGIEISLNLKADSGINSMSLSSFSDLMFDEENHYLSEINEYTDLNTILDKLIELSKAGNHLATELYEKIKEKFEGLLNDISLKIDSLDKLLEYYELSEIFDATLSLDSIKKLPISIIEDSKIMLNKLNIIYGEIASGETKVHVDNFKNYVYEYVKQSHILVNKIFNNLKELSNILLLEKNELTEVSTYYLNSNSTYSYVNIIEQIENILNNYFIDEYNNINPKVQTMLTEFENNYQEILKSPENMINHLIYKIENKSYFIEDASDEDLENIIIYLNNSTKNIKNIYEKIKSYIKKEIGLNEGSYFITNYDIESNNKSFFPILINSKEVAKKLDNDDYIDKLFDEIMIDFEDNITNITMEMEKQKEEQFPTDENILKYSTFDDSTKEKMQNDITKIKVKIATTIKEENDIYFDEIKKSIKNFKDSEKENLNQLIIDLDVILSEENLNNIEKLYEKAYYSIFEKIKKEIETNKNLAIQYLEEYNKIINDDNYLKDVLVKEKIIIDWSQYYYETWYEKGITIFSKYKTNRYLSKYNTIKANFEYSKKYILENFCAEIVSEYKTVLSKLKEKLQSIRNNKITEKYPNFSELDFFDNNIRTIDKLFNRLKIYLSDEKFNSKYITPMNNIKNNNIQNINSIQNDLEKKHNIINKLELINYNWNDFCLYYRRKQCSGCTNCDYYIFTLTAYYCGNLPNYSNNYAKLTKIDISGDTNLIKFKQEFNKFYIRLNEKVQNYNTIWKNLENKFITIKEETLGKKLTLNIFQPLTNWYNSILSEKYEGELIKASYKYYQKLIEERLKNIFDDSFNKYNETFNNLLSQIELNYDYFTNSISEFRIMATICNTIFSQNSTRDYFNIIIDFQKTEFNYSISFYYSYLKKVMDESHSYILSKIPINDKGFNDILNLRKKEVNDIFNKLFSNLTNSQNTALSLNNQKTILNVQETNFFKVNYILTDYLYDLKNCLSEIINQMSKFISLYRDEISLISRFYLEIQHNWRRTNKLYDEVNHENFVILNLDKFKEIIFDNWIFDKDDFISKLSQVIIESIQEINNDFLIKRNNYINLLENEIERQYTDISIEKSIINLFSTGINNLTSTQIENIKSNIDSVINLIKEKIINESKRIKDTSNSYNKDTSKIKKTIENIKSKIIKNLNTSLAFALDGFYQNLNKNYYSDCLIEHFNEYIQVTEMEVSSDKYKEYELYNCSYKIGETILNLLKEDVIKNYNTTIKDLINQKYELNLEKIKSSVNYEKIIILINEIDSTLNSYLINSLETYGISENEEGLYSSYDFSEDINSEINSIISQNIEINIKNEIEKTKGTNYESKKTCELDFSLSGMNLIRKTCDNFRDFLKTEKTAQNEKISNLIKSIIYSNFDDLLNNIIPTFGSQFFERIIKYNQNFKINSLYNNLKFSLVQTLLYYQYLYKTTSDILPKELKTRIYNLNNLDSTVELKNNQILQLLIRKISEFIIESRNDIIKKYMEYLLENDSIQNSFDKTVMDKIYDNLIELQPDLEKKYQNLLESFFENKLITSYTDFINKKTKEMVKSVYEQRELLKAQIDDLFSLDSEKVLIDINEKVNLTFDAINEYNEHQKTFEVSKDIKDYFNIFASSKIIPIISEFQIKLNKLTKDKIVENINKNSESIEKLNPDKFILESKNSSKYFYENYFSNINSSIQSYGIDDDDYKKNLDIERNKKKESLRRRLSGEETEEDMQQNSREKINDKGIEESFQKILNITNFTLSFFNGLESFNEIENRINNYIKKIKLGYKTSSDLILENDYEEEISKFLNNKLLNLTNYSLEYYNAINGSYYDLKNSLNKSLIDLYILLNKCADITYKTFNQEYDQISKSTSNINITHYNDKKKFNVIPYEKKTEHSLRTAQAKIVKFIEHSEFKFNLSFENGIIKKPKVECTIVDKCRPKKIIFYISSPFGNCGKTINEIEVNLNDANYTMNLEYNSESNNINITTLTDFEKYEYSIEVYQIDEINGTMSFDSMGIEFDIENIGNCENNQRRELKNKYLTIVEAKRLNKSTIIEG